MDNEKPDVERIDKDVEKREVKQVLPIKKKEEIKPKTETVSITQKVKDLVKIKLDEGFELKDKNSKLELNKQILSELHLQKGWSSDINKAIREVAIEKKIVISDLGFKNDKIGDMIVNLVQDKESTTATEIQSNVTSQSPHSALPKTSQSPHSALPKETGSTQTQTRTEQSKEPEKKSMSESSQKKLISAGLTKLILPLYTAVGIFELDEEEEKEEGKLSTVKQAKKDFEELAGEINNYLIENQIKLPAFLNHLAIIISIFVVMVLPVIKFKMFSGSKEAKPTYDSDAEKVKVD